MSLTLPNLFVQQLYNFTIIQFNDYSNFNIKKAELND